MKEFALACLVCVLIVWCVKNIITIVRNRKKKKEIKKDETSRESDVVSTPEDSDNK